SNMLRACFPRSLRQHAARHEAVAGHRPSPRPGVGFSACVQGRSARPPGSGTGQRSRSMKDDGRLHQAVETAEEGVDVVGGGLGCDQTLHAFVKVYGEIAAEVDAATSELVHDLVAADVACSITE